MQRISAFQWLFIPAMCVLITLLAGAISFYIKLETNDPDIVSKTVIENASLWVFWAILSPLILILSRRFSFERSCRIWSLLVHFSVGTVWAILVQGLHLLLLFILKDLTGFDSEDLYGPYRDWVLSVLPNMLIYWVILTINLIFLYYERYQNEMLKASKLDAQLSNARLQALQMQLHPHFLFNTVHSISALALDNEIRDAVKMINRLSEFLRLTLDNADAQIVPLEDELEFTRRYLEIERIRFQDRLTVDMDIDPQALRAEVPTLILQPLVENAMRHAVDSSSDDSRIQIAARLQNDKILMEVRDDGKDSKKIAGQNGATGLWYVQDYRGKKVVQHGGRHPGMTAQVGFMPEENLGVVILTNMDALPVRAALMFRVFDAFLGGESKDRSAELLPIFKTGEQQKETLLKQLDAKLAQAPKPPLDLSAYTGIYEEPMLGQVRILEESGKLVLRYSAEMSGDLAHLGNNNFIVLWRNSVYDKAQVGFTVNASGKVEEFKLMGFTLKRANQQAKAEMSAEPTVIQTGKWNLTADAGGQTIPIMLELKQDGTALNGSLSSPIGGGAIKNARFVGNLFAGTAQVDFQGQQMEIALKGTINGEKMTGTISGPGLPPISFTAIKEK